AGALRIGAFRVACGAAYPGLVMRTGAVKAADGPSAAVAELVRAGLEAVADRDALIEHEAFAVPQAVVGGDGFEIVQNSTLQVVHRVDPLGFQESGRFLAADAARAEHGDPWRFAAAQQRLALAAEPGREIPE